MNNLATYLPQDRRRALASGQTLPDRAYGSVLFADISGFTPFTELLRHAYGSRRGAEELTKQLDRVYIPLIAEVERYGGSVTGFAGDSMTCWFDGAGQLASPRAVACAVALQRAMQGLGEIALPNGVVVQLTVKIGVATGEVRRLVVGDEGHYWLDVLAGETVNHTAVAEQLATAPEILLDTATIHALGKTITLSDWRTHAETAQRFGVLAHFTAPLPPSPAPPLPELDEETTRPWLHPLVYERETTGHPLLQTDFRPCVALFVRFVGIDYEADTAADQLNQFIRPLQAILAHYEGTLIDLTFGDKGSYAYINFGALSIHEDDARRAAKTALRLRELAQTLPFLEPLQISITSGVMRTGAYGGITRRHYGALGNEVNVAARLMSQAALGDILVTMSVQRAIVTDFVLVGNTAVSLKGKSEPMPTFTLIDEQKQPAIRLQEPAYALPMVGRQTERQQIEEKLDLTITGQSQIIGIVAEAGWGKSRLVAETIRIARHKGFAGYGGACQSDALNTPYHVWKTIWQALLEIEIDPTTPHHQLQSALEQKIKTYAPLRLAAIPLLNLLLGTNIPENEFTRPLDPKTRQTALHALLEDYLKRKAQAQPLLIIIEDMHWIDALSYDLLQQLVKATINLPITFLLAYRLLPSDRLTLSSLESLPHFTRIELNAFTTIEAQQLIQLKLAQLYPSRPMSLPAKPMQTFMARTQGNPFYLEELINYLHGLGLDPTDIDDIDLPDSLHTLILSRIDQLNALEKRTLRVASIIGRRFRAKWLMGYYPTLGTTPQVKASLEQLHALDITPREATEPELTYLFKHVVTHEVTYESLPFGRRAQLHEQLAAYLEQAYPHALPLEALAFHYGRSENRAKQIEYLRRAGEAAQSNFANEAALDFYGKLLPLLDQSTAAGLKEDKTKFEIYLKRGRVFELRGNFDAAESDYHAALQVAQDESDPALAARAQLALGKLMHLRGDYAPAWAWLGQAQEQHTALKDKVGLAQVLIEMGIVSWHKGEHTQARETLNKALALAREADDKLNVAQAFNILGLVAWSQGDYTTARAMYEESLRLRREIGDKKGIAASLGNLGLVNANAKGDYATTRALHEECLSLFREIGDKQGIAGALNNLGNAVRIQGDTATARVLYEESLSLFREMGDRKGIAFALNNLGVVVMAQGDSATARVLYEESLNLKREMGDKQGIANSLGNLGDVAFAQGDNTTARAIYTESLTLSKEMADKSNEAIALLGLGLVDLAENKPQARANILGSLRLRVEMGAQIEQTSSLVGMAGLAVGAGDAVRAAQILGAVASALKVLEADVQPAVLRFHAQTVAVVQAQLGEAAFRAAWAEGENWSLEEVVAYALEESSHE